jgi:hypothetical protein
MVDMQTTKRVVMLALTAALASRAQGESPSAKQYLKNLLSPLAFAGSAASAGIGQWRDRPPEWKEGGEGYARRFASAFAEHATRETLRYGLATLTHEDNRYVRSHGTGFRSRVVYALESTVLASGEDGRRRFSVSNVGSLAGASLISRAWQPPSTAGMESAGSNLAISLGVNAGMNVVREFLKK